MDQSPVNLRLDPRRLKQLKSLSHAMNMTSAGVIAHMIKERIAAGVISADIPGIAIERQGDNVSITIDDNEPTYMSVSGAKQLSSTVHDVVEGRTSPTLININHSFGVSKQGTGFKVMLPFGKKEYSFPADLAKDFADLLDNAAA